MSVPTLSNNDSTPQEEISTLQEQVSALNTLVTTNQESFNQQIQEISILLTAIETGTSAQFSEVFSQLEALELFIVNQGELLVSLFNFITATNPYFWVLILVE